MQVQLLFSGRGRNFLFSLPFGTTKKEDRGKAVKDKFSKAFFKSLLTRGKGQYK